jgi:pilus assembly protein CpaB
LVLLIGIFLALVAFVLIIVVFGKNQSENTPAPSAPTTVAVVVASTDIGLGTKITQDEVTTKQIPAGDKPAGSYSDVALVIGQTARMSVAAQQLITPDVFAGSSGSISNIEVPAGFVAIAVQVDQVTGVGTIIKAGDHVDVVTGITGGQKVPVTQWQTIVPPASFAKVPEDTYNSTTVKTLVQGIQVLGTLLPPPTAAATTGGPTPSGGTSLNGQLEIVILAVTTQEAEVIKFAQIEGDMTLVLRSAADCQNTDGTPAPCASAKTTGITLRILVDNLGVVPPQIVEVIQPQHIANPNAVVGAPNR